MKKNVLAFLIFIIIVFSLTAIFLLGCLDTNSNPSTQEPPSNNTATMGERMALASAKNYLRVMPFSKIGLIEQLEFEGYSYTEATYAVNNCGANWKEQAVKSAKNYLRVMPFSRKELIEQLEFEGYTYEEAVYGVDQAYR